MKKIYKLPALILAFLLLLTLAACGKNTENGKKTDAVEKVEALIDAIGEVSEKSGDAIQKAEQEYRYLSAGEQMLVSNHSKLLRARDEYSDAVQAFILGEWYCQTTASSDDALPAAHATPSRYKSGDTIRYSLMILEGGQGEYRFLNKSELWAEPFDVNSRDVTWTLEDGFLTVSYTEYNYRLSVMDHYVTVYQVNFNTGMLVRVLDNTVLRKQE